MKKGYIVPSLALLCIIILLFSNPIPQHLAYHEFADKREFIGVPNFLNVVTNLPFIIIGILGLRLLGKLRSKHLKRIVTVLFIGFIILTAGSGYYHLWPNNETLSYDRIPIVIIEMSFFGFIIYDCIDKKRGYAAFVLFNVLGVLSVVLLVDN